MTDSKKQILNETQIRQIVKRMAYEIYEDNFDQKELIFAGIDTNGVLISEQLKKEIEEISEISVDLLRIDIDKSAESQPVVTFSKNPDQEGFTIIVVDDVLNSGSTMIYALDPFLKMKVSKMQTAVLVNRSHKRFPIAVDYKGLELATTIENHIHVELKEEIAAYVY